MPSKKKQLNIRLDDETEALIAELKPAVRDALGVRVSVADLFRLGLRELKARYLADGGESPQTPSKSRKS